MSSYLTIKKDGVTIGCWSGSSIIYQTFHDYAPFDKEEEFNPETRFNDGIKQIKEHINTLNSHKDTYNRMLEGNLSYDERFETIKTIKDIEEDIKDYEVNKYYIYFMFDCYEASKYPDEECPENNKWTWCVD